jgi:hypothetical protein
MNDSARYSENHLFSSIITSDFPRPQSETSACFRAILRRRRTDRFSSAKPGNPNKSRSTAAATAHGRRPVGQRQRQREGLKRSKLLLTSREGRQVSEEPAFNASFNENERGSDVRETNTNRLNRSACQLTPH